MFPPSPDSNNDGGQQWRLSFFHFVHTEADLVSFLSVWKVRLLDNRKKEEIGMNF